MPQPDSRGTPSPWDAKSEAEKLPVPVGEVVSSQDLRDVGEIARALVAHGGGAASYDLALDLVLHQVVEEARFATGATGAAIALARAGEMVCRASSGPDAPDLGVRVETTSGLSGACLQAGTIQQCGDTETDPRVNAEACRRLGVRSILVLPLGDGPQPFGVLEVFSSLVEAFGEGDIRELQILAHRVVANSRVAANKRGAEGVAALRSEVLPSEVLTDEVPPSAVSPAAREKTPATAFETKASPELRTSPVPEQMAESAAESSADEGFGRRNEIWTAVLGILVIVTAVLLGLALGWRGAIGRELNGRLNDGVNGGSNPASSGSQAAAANRGNDSGLQQETAGAPSGDLATPAQSGSLSQPGSQQSNTGAATSLEPPSGGLVVTQNGKVIYRLPPGEEAGTTRTAASATASTAMRDGAENSVSRLIHRVEPQYPPEARAQKIQGVVILDVQIGSEGAVHNIAVVDGNPALADAAVQAVRQWRYQPYAMGGQPVEMQTRVRIRFTLPPG
jgi:TonB family protein